MNIFDNTVNILKVLSPTSSTRALGLANKFIITEMNTNITKLIDKIKFVSRQSVVVISNFLLISNKLNSSNELSKNIVDNDKNDLHQSTGLKM